MKTNIQYFQQSLDGKSFCQDTTRTKGTTHFTANGGKMTPMKEFAKFVNMRTINDVIDHGGETNEMPVMTFNEPDDLKYPKHEKDVLAMPTMNFEKPAKKTEPPRNTDDGGNVLEMPRMFSKDL